MSNKCYAVVLVLAGMVCGILLVSLASSPASASLPTEGRNTTMNVSTTSRPRAVPPVAFPGAASPFAAAPNIHVYPVGIIERGIAYAYIVKDGKLWYCEGEKVRAVGLH